MERIEVIHSKNSSVTLAERKLRYVTLLPSLSSFLNNYFTQEGFLVVT